MMIGDSFAAEHSDAHGDDFGIIGIGASKFL